jgi:FkbM family methyltransferase
MTRKVIYDLGSNNGDDIPYYLMKCDLVVAVEANPMLCQQIREKFSDAIGEGRLVVENYVLITGEIARQVQEKGEVQVPFYIHLKNHVLSQFPRPSASELSDFIEVALPSVSLIRLIGIHGAPYYVKIDLEHFDNLILRELFENRIYPPYISVESHHIDAFASLIALGGYRAFKLVDGPSVATRYRQHSISTPQGTVNYSFPTHSAGPFGGDISGAWMSADNFFGVLGIVGLGWKDIHATRVEEADPGYAPKPTFNLTIKY